MDVQIMETASSNGRGIVAQVDAVMVKAISAEKVPVNAAFMGVTVTDVRGAMNTFGLPFAEAADDVSFTKKFCPEL